MQIKELEASNTYILCICEGTAEQEIIELLLEHDKLIFKRTDLIDNRVIRTRSAAKIQEEYLSLDYNKPLAILRILDSKKEKFKLGKAYQERYQDRIVNILTNPEIEILMIIHRGDYSKYSNKRKSEIKPSTFCKTEYGISGIKSSGTFENFFGDVDSLLGAIIQYAGLTKNPGFTLKDLLK